MSKLFFQWGSPGGHNFDERRPPNIYGTIPQGRGHVHQSLSLPYCFQKTSVKHLLTSAVKMNRLEAEHECSASKI